MFWLNTSFVHCKLWILNICWKFRFGCVKTGTCNQTMGHLVLLGVTEPCRFSVTVLPDVSSWCVFHRFNMLSHISHLAWGQVAGYLASLSPCRREGVRKSRGHTLTHKHYLRAAVLRTPAQFTFPQLNNRR